MIISKFSGFLIILIWLLALFFLLWVLVHHPDGGGWGDSLAPIQWIALWFYRLGWFQRILRGRARGSLLLLHLFFLSGGRFELYGGRLAVYGGIWRQVEFDVDEGLLRLASTVCGSLLPLNLLFFSFRWQVELDGSREP